MKSQVFRALEKTSRVEADPIGNFIPDREGRLPKSREIALFNQRNLECANTQIDQADTMEISVDMSTDLCLSACRELSVLMRSHLTPMGLARPTHSCKRGLLQIPSTKEFQLTGSRKIAFYVVAPALWGGEVGPHTFDLLEEP